jgi:hypothetical protein
VVKGASRQSLSRSSSSVKLLVAAPSSCVVVLFSIRLGALNCKLLASRLLCNLALSLPSVLLKIEQKGVGVMTDEFVYYEARKRELNIRLIRECRCDERLKA